MYVSSRRESHVHLGTTSYLRLLELVFNVFEAISSTEHSVKAVPTPAARLLMLWHHENLVPNHAQIQTTIPTASLTSCILVIGHVARHGMAPVALRFH